MNKFSSTFLKGFLTLLPVALTIYIIVTVIRLGENLLGSVIKSLISEENYVPGFGLILTLLVIFSFGLMLNNLITASFFKTIERRFLQIPIIKTVYAPLRDLMNLFSRSKKNGELNMVVLVELQPGFKSIGLVTRENFLDLVSIKHQTNNHVSVYVPFSYALGGHTYLVVRDKIEIIDLPAEKALSLAITGWIKTEDKEGSF